ncbi:hypothetical protein AMATHDRAFT_64599 [Amanita thiersii Skay4041]|uniref:DUF6534 domain-containing protein n=1 Tax=Amanita thiersii Skay4041 TaxID=703135 RepID=A0A2A9NM35_9AGAR|nr:hypothetical protein AMATHDRAFT_64599 [Amanita thiersii Skay4041]
MDPQPAHKIKLDDTFGAALIGAIVSAMMYGITNLQTYFYYMTYPKDSLQNKLLVCAVWVLDTLQMALVSLSIYHYLVTNYSNPAALAIGHWSLFASIAVNVTIAVISQCYFTVRIYRLCSERWRLWVTTFIALVVIAHFALGIETVVFMFIKKEFIKLADITLVAAMPFALFAVLSDIFVAVALCILLHGSRTGMRSTNALISTLIIYAINRCLLTSVVAIVEVIVFAAAPKSLWFVGIDFVIGKLYANSLLATLNSRNAVRDANTSSINTVKFSSMRSSDPSVGISAAESVKTCCSPAVGTIWL